MILQIPGLEGFISGVYFGSSIEQYALFFITLIAFVIAGKIIYFFIKKLGSKLAKRTKSEFDDMLLEVTEGPFIIFSMVVGMMIGTNFLTITDEGIRSFIFDVIGTILILDIAWYLIKLVDGIINHFVIPAISKTKSRLDDQIVPIVSKLSKAAIVAISFIVILSNFGYDVTAMIAGLGIGGLALAFAAQETIADMFGGISIFTSKPFIVGDIVEVSGVTGTVEQVGLRFTRIRDFDGRLNTMPNSKVARDVIKNISSESARRVTMNLGVTYDTDPKKIEQAVKIVREVVNKHPDCKDEPRTVFNDFKDFSLNLWVTYYITDDERKFYVMHEINSEIKKKFDGAKINFAFPTQTIHVQK
ncbi:MAG: mechanosensitive ion channel family protein [Candidatus Diapherotrites archaeon]